ncbi:MAG: hypothetical protein M3441_07790 [Chloroflexota bacterium]|nr:hypothetical protein [Chloroflexota bacterium]
MDVRVELEEWGPNVATVERLSRRFLEHGRLREHLRDARHRILAFELLDSGEKTKRPTPPRQFRSVVYDYTNNRTLLVNGPIAGDNLEQLEVVESSTQPLPNEEEFQEAVSILANDPEIGPGIREGVIQPYRPMPPLIFAELPDGRIERTLGVGLRSEGDGPRHRLVGVNMIKREVLSDIPGVFRPSDNDCGPPASGGCEQTSAPGQVRVRVRQGRTVLWTFVLVRPSASSGTNGSGVELRYLDYRGKRVLYRAHVPILNIEYFQDGIDADCGPTYRDWQNAENCFEANGQDFTPGFRLCPDPAKTILDSGSDAGNFAGVAIYVEGQEVVMVSEMEAGWYRYISEWRLHVDGTIRPRFGFAATDNRCTCSDHHHHVYWRLDFDIRSAGNNVAEEFNDLPLSGGSNWHTKRFEVRRPRDNGRKRKWRVRNTETNEGYELVPGPNDGDADTYGVGDLWVLRYRGTELDDGQGFTSDPIESRAKIDRFVNGELVEDTDVVLWYSGHFRHSPHGHGSHIVGPDLVPFNW